MSFLKNVVKSVDKIQGSDLMMSDELLYSLLNLIFGNQKHILIPDFEKYISSTGLEILNSKEQIKEYNTLLESLTIKDINQIRKEIEFFFGKELSHITHEDILKIIPSKIIKKFGIYYTKTEAAFLLSRLSLQNKIKTVLDPACGNGRLLANLKRIRKDLDLYGCDISFFVNRKIGINDEFTFLGRMDFLKQNKSDLIASKMIPTNGFDMIIMNPPFTRTEYLTKEYRKFLRNKFREKTQILLNDQMGLHCFFLLHVTEFLNDRGTLAAILPTSIFYSTYGTKIRKFLKNNFGLEYLITSSSEDSFSENSSFKEILLIARKNWNIDKCKFVTILSKLNEKNKNKILKDIIKNGGESCKIVEIDNKDMDYSKNWIQFFNINKKDVIFSHNNFNKVNQNVISVRRGLEAYGSEFFFIPNKFWQIVKIKPESLVICHKKFQGELSIPYKYLVSGLIFPKNHKNEVIPNIHEYFLSIPPLSLNMLPDDICKYIKWGSNQNLPILRNTFSKRFPWYSFIYYQMQSNSFFGNVFVTRKLRLNTMGVIAHYTENRYPASKGYYVIQCDPKLAKALTSWLNSSLFLSQLILKRREIAKFWGEIMKSDLLECHCINFNKLKYCQIKEISSALNILSNKKLPSIISQINEDYRKRFDMKILNTLKISNIVDMLQYNLINLNSLVDKD